MSETALSTSLLATTLQAVAAQLGDQLPAAYGMEPGDVLVAGDLDTHLMPEAAQAVRWPLGAGEATLVIAVTPDAADMLRTGPPEGTLVEALTPLVMDALVSLAPLLEGQTPMLGDGEEVPADEALASGPGDAVSLPLDDAGIHRATIALRMVVSDVLMVSAQPAAYEDDMAGPADQPSAGGPVVEPVDGADADPYAEPEADPVAAAGLAGIGMTVPTSDPVDGIPLDAGPAGTPGAGIPVVGQAPRRPQAAPRPQVAGPQAEAHPAEFASFDQLTALPGAGHSMAMLGEVEMGVTAELGRTRMTVRDVLGLNPGSIIELDRAAGSPVDVVVNGTLIARGEVVVIDEEFGIRITEIMGMADEADAFPLQVAQ